MRKSIISATFAGVAFTILAVSPAFAQEAGTPPTGMDAPAAATTTPGSVPTGTEGNSGSSGTDTTAGQVKDTDVFGFDISMGAANLTETQRMAAIGTCKQAVTLEPQRYSSEVKAFCQTIQ